MQEKEHICHVLRLLQDARSRSSDGTIERSNSYMTLFLAHASRAIFYPANFIYPISARFLLQRPELDPYDVPMLFGMLFSSSDDWKKERGWILRFLADGLQSSDDWRIFRRRHTWDLIATLFQAAPSDRILRNGTLEVRSDLAE